MPEESPARFTGRTYDHHELEAMDLAARKRAHDLTVSVVIPARNEEATVAGVVGRVHDDLVAGVDLVDDLLVVDGDSADATWQRARAAGARVVAQSEVLPEAGGASGKGDALWKGLAASTGDLVVFVDADIHDFDARYVTGLLGPLLCSPEVAYVKAAFDRPLRLGGEVHPTGGGRVTELTARPLLTAFWPELAWLVQPLAGEYAGRRALLERLPFVCGYGVELALLIDVAELAGVDVIAQVDLGRRLHDHQPLDALGRMAGEILHVALDRLAARGRVVLPEPVATWLPQPVRDEAGRLQLDGAEVAFSERPPLATWRASR